MGISLLEIQTIKLVLFYFDIENGSIKIFYNKKNCTNNFYVDAECTNIY